MTHWYYEKNGSRSDSITEEEMINLINKGGLQSTTLLWRDGMENWQPLLQTPLAVHLPQTTTPPALPHAAPPLPAGNPALTSLNTTLVYALALAPLVGLLLRVFLLGLSGVPEEYMDSAIASTDYWYIPVILNVGLSYLDAWKLREHGVETRQLGNITWLVPVWLWKRAQLLKQSPVYFWVWIVSFVITLFVTTQ